MTSTGQNVEMYRGDTKDLTVVVTCDDGSPVVLNGALINYVVYKQNTGVIVITKTQASGVTMTQPLNGIMTINLLPADTEPLLGTYLHECEITDSLGKVGTIFTGKFTVLDSKA